MKRAQPIPRLADNWKAHYTLGVMGIAIAVVVFPILGIVAAVAIFLAVPIG